MDLFQYVPEETNNEIYLRSQRIPQRFTKCKRSAAQTHLKNYHELVKELSDRPRNVTWHTYKDPIAIRKRFSEYLQQYSDEVSNETNFRLDAKSTVNTVSLRFYKYWTNTLQRTYYAFQHFELYF